MENFGFFLQCFFCFEKIKRKGKKTRLSSLSLSYRPPLATTAALFATGGGANTLLVAALTSSLIIIRIAAARMLCVILVDSPSKKPLMPSAA